MPRPRARELGIEIGTSPPGPLNAITDVPNVSVGHVSLKSDDGSVRTGVTAILPHEGNLFTEKVSAAVHVINGFGKSVGFPQVYELGNIETPILLTNTLNVWTVADALVDYLSKMNPEARSFNPIVGECNDGRLNDILGRHVKADHVFQALSQASQDNVEEGCVGAGMGMRGFSWKGGIGTSSRVLQHDSGEHTIGVIVLTNTGRAAELRIDGVPFGREVVPGQNPPSEPEEGPGSIMMIIGTDAPLTSRQLTRISKRAAFGLACTGAKATHGSGDFVIAFSNRYRFSLNGTPEFQPDALIPETRLSEFFKATVEATEESILNSLLKAETTEGWQGNVIQAIPIDQVRSVLARYGR